MTEWSIAGPIIMGVVIGFIELVFVHQDESGMGWLGHGIHALPTMILFLFITMNAEWAISFTGMEVESWMIYSLYGLIGIIATVKVKVAAAVVGKAGEKTWHALIIGILIAVAPFIWKIVAPLIEGFGLPIQ